MEPSAESSSRSARLILKQLLLPGRYYFYLQIAISLCLLLLLNARAIGDFINGQIGTDISQTDLSDTFSSKTQSIFNFFTNSIGGRLPQILFGMLVGSAIYLAFWVFNNLVTDVRNDIVADSYQHPTSYNRSAYWRSIITDRLLLLCVAIIFFGYLLMLLRLLPILAKELYRAVANFSWPFGPLKLIAIILATVALLHGLVILARILGNAWRYVFS